METDMIHTKRSLLGLVFLAAVGFAQAQTMVEPATVPAAKKSAADLYLMAKDVPAFLAKQEKVLFLDVRTRAEAMYVGMATGVDALVPFVEHQEIMTEWDAQRNIYKLDPNQEFVTEARRRLAEKGLQKTDVVVLICRSGDRSGRAATRLQQDGFTRVYSVIDGFEGDMSPAGRREVNGWKNAGLPWSYKLDKAKMFFVR
jgi:rhodanese-related sulfurtransferase